jgi:hypothetical protein
MGILSRTREVVRQWAGLNEIDDDEIEVCVLFANGHPGTPCDGALQALIEDFKREFKGTDLSDLRPPDLKTGKLKTVYALADFVAGSRASTLRALAADIRADQPKRAAAKKQPKRKAVTKKTDKRAKASKRGGQ